MRRKQKLISSCPYSALRDGARDGRCDEAHDGADGVGDAHQCPGQIGRDVLLREGVAAVGAAADADGYAQHDHRESGVAVHEAHDDEGDGGSVVSWGMKAEVRIIPRNMMRDSWMRHSFHCRGLLPNCFLNQMNFICV